MVLQYVAKLAQIFNRDATSQHYNNNSGTISIYKERPEWG